MREDKEFYVGYFDEMGPNTKRNIKGFIVLVVLIVVFCAMVFGLSQRPFANSTFEFGSDTEITGIYHEMPYPMLRVEVAENEYKNIVLLGFGKSSINPFLKKIRRKGTRLTGKILTIKGNLIYYNGKTLIQLTDEENVSIKNQLFVSELPIKDEMGRVSFMGEIVDPKCYFGVMKPGYGKIHRSCAVRCISGGIPPVLATKDNEGNDRYVLLTDSSGNPINEAILNYIGKPAKVTGHLERMEDWDFLRLNTGDIEVLDQESGIYVQ
ncbi:hypothetical protein J0X14_08150 [Muricauda sp. CAU 1633]|uniref:hypothetical protein n=1 Tax=Allomuricauda sp. CAU 1633 TaxID=2816036 RepID=UPI001A8D8A05|nr:hypothetical protein [Muricauda sp. CAU 1633]MBO0322263.1 hypothetical protein [Muricauda sp. CAU 1633]